LLGLIWIFQHFFLFSFLNFSFILLHEQVASGYDG
jgi:hypothetical protein